MTVEIKIKFVDPKNIGRRNMTTHDRLTIQICKREMPVYPRIQFDYRADPVIRLNLKEALSLRDQLNLMLDEFDKHTTPDFHWHPTGLGPSGPPISDGGKHSHIMPCTSKKIVVL